MGRVFGRGKAARLCLLVLVQEIGEDDARVDQVKHCLEGKEARNEEGEQVRRGVACTVDVRRVRKGCTLSSVAAIWSGSAALDPAAPTPPASCAGLVGSSRVMRKRC